MRTQNQLKIFNNIKKSHKLLIGSFFIFLGILLFSKDYLLKMKDQVYSNMKIAMSDVENNNVSSNSENDSILSTDNTPDVENNKYTIDYSKYLGVLEIPKIWLKRGFYNIDSRYNNIQYNVTMVKGSTLPDVPNGNLILMAHSGDSYISYFAYLYKLSIGDDCYVTYNGVGYHYQIVDIYDVNKNGVVSLRRNKSKTVLTLITCTKDNDYLQTVYIAELV